MCKACNKTKVAYGFSLAEVIAVLTIGAMILVGALGIYSRAEHSVEKITNNLKNVRLPSEVLQRIAEDLDNVIASDSDTQITIENTLVHGFSSARLKITRTYKDSKDAEQTFEEIIWQSSYDYDSVDSGLILYRHHSGIGLEDKVLDKNKEVWERELFVPICSGVTLFKVNAVSGEDLLDKWAGSLPTGISIILSFAQPVKRANGILDVPDKDKITRVMAIDRTRKIRFEIGQEGDENFEDITKDANSAEDIGFPMDRTNKTPKDK